MADFTYTPTEVQYDGPVYAVGVTQSENFKKDFQLLDTNTIKRFRLIFKKATVTTHANILTHHAGVYGGYSSFSWTTVPNHIDSGTNKTVRYVGQPVITNAYAGERRFDIEVEFEEAV